MNNFDISDLYNKDYAEKINYWCNCLSYYLIKRGVNFEKILIPFPMFDKNCPIKYTVNKDLYEKYKNITELISLDYFLELLDLMKHFNKAEQNPFPSTGISIVYWSYKTQNNYLDPSNFCGFSFFEVYS